MTEEKLDMNIEKEIMELAMWCEKVGDMNKSMNILFTFIENVSVHGLNNLSRSDIEKQSDRTQLLSAIMRLHNTIDSQTSTVH